MAYTGRSLDDDVEDESDDETRMTLRRVRPCCRTDAAVQPATSGRSADFDSPRTSRSVCVIRASVRTVRYAIGPGWLAEPTCGWFGSDEAGP